MIQLKDGNVYGYSNVYLEGERIQVRNQETNLGNVSADANADVARDALGLTNEHAVVSIKNGGGIRAQIGTIINNSDGTVSKVAPEVGGEVSQLDVENALRFDNKLMVFDTTAQGLLNILNTTNALNPNNGGFIQIGGVRFSYDPSKAAGSRVQDVVLINELGEITAVVADNGVVVAGAPSLITAVVLNFTANGGDQYPIKANGSNFRFLLNDGTVSAAVSPTANFTDPAIVPANAIGEQQAFAEYFQERHGTQATAYNVADTGQALDTRIQNQVARTDTVLVGDYLLADATATFAENDTGTAFQGVSTGLGGTITYTLTGADAALFDVSSTGAVTFKAAPNFESAADAGANNVYDVRVVASNGINTTEQDAAITVTDVNDPVELRDSSNAVIGTFATIQAAVDAAVDGQTILIAAGTFTENVTINKAVTVLGANAGVAGNGARGAASSVLGNFTVASSSVTIDGLDFNGGASAIRGEAGANAYDNLTIVNNVVANTTDSAIRFGLGSGGGIGSDNWTISGNKIDAINGNALTGMVLFNVTGLTVANNVLNHDLATATGRRGINLDGVENAVISGNTINMGLVAPTDATTASAATPWAIQLSMSDRAVTNVDVTGNSIAGASTGIVGLSQRSMVNVDIENNIVSNVVSGIVLNGGGTAPVVSGVTMDADVIGNTITAAVNAIFVRDLHDKAANGPVMFEGLDMTGNTINSGIVQIGRLEPSQATANGLLNVTGSATIDGSSNNDVVRVEGSGAVTVNAGAGNDTLVGGAGNDTLDGGADTDTAVFSGNFADYTATRIGTSVTLTGADGTDSVSNVESFQFADGTRAVGLVGNLAAALTGAQAVLANGSEDTAYTVSTASLLTGYTDANGDTLSVANVTASNGSVTDNGDGTYTVTPTANFNGAVTLSYSVTDGNGGSTAASLGFTLAAVNDAPTALALSNSTVAENRANASVVGTLLPTDVDNASGFTYQMLDSAGGRFYLNSTTGVVSVGNSNLLDFEAATSHSITVRVTDAAGASYTQALTISLTNVVENQTYTGTAAANVFTASTPDNWTVDAKAGNDTITTLGGADTVFAGGGNDTVSTAGGNDTIYFTGAGGGFDAVDGGEGNDTILANANNTVIGLSALAGVEAISSSGFSAVRILGTAAGDSLDFSATTLTGITEINGGAGNDTLIGSAGADTIVGGAGKDTLTGGGGADTFVFKAVGESTVANSDRILDFVSGLDRIDLSAIDANAPLAGNQAFTFIGTDDFTGLGQVRIGMSGGQVILSGNTTGNLAADFMIRLDSNPLLTIGDFVL